MLIWREYSPPKKKKRKCTMALAFIKAYSTFNTESTWWCSWKSTSIWHWRPVYMGTLSQLCGLTRTFNVHGLGRVGRVERILFKPHQECDRQPSQSFPGQRTMFRLQWEQIPSAYLNGSERGQPLHHLHLFGGSWMPCYQGRRPWYQRRQMQVL